MEGVRIYILMIWNCLHINGEILCNYQLLPWTSAMAWCQNKTGVPVSANQIHVPNRYPKETSFWTAEYATRELHVSYMPENPVSCGYRTRSYNMFGAIKFGDCANEKFYICCDDPQQLDAHCVKIGTWLYAVSCATSKYTEDVVNGMYPMGDYWVAQAYTYETNTLSVHINNLPIPDQCGSVSSNSVLRFENNCSSLRYSMCDLPDLFVGLDGFSECDPTNVPQTSKSVSPTDRQTTRSHFTTTMTSKSSSITASMRTPSATLLTTHITKTMTSKSSSITASMRTPSATMLTTHFTTTMAPTSSSITASMRTPSATLLTTKRTRTERSTSRTQPYIKPEQHAFIPTRMPDSASFSNSNECDYANVTKSTTTVSSTSTRKSITQIASMNSFFSTTLITRQTTTGFSSRNQMNVTTSINSNSPLANTTDSILGIGLGAGLGICAIIFVVAGVVLLKRRNANSRDAKNRGGRINKQEFTANSASDRRASFSQEKPSVEAISGDYYCQLDSRHVNKTEGYEDLCTVSKGVPHMTDVTHDYDVVNI